MIYKFKKVLNLENLSELNNINMHIAFKKYDVSAIDGIIDYAHNISEGEKHIEFIQGYKSQIKEHISSIEQTLLKSEALSDKLSKFLGEKNKDEYTKKDNITIGGHSFYISYYKGEFTFFTHINYDTHLKMDMYLIFTYLYNGKKLILQNSSIGYTDKALNDLRNHPVSVEQKIKKMDTLTKVEDVNNHYSRCENLLKQLFYLNKITDIISYDDSYYSELFGEPIKLLVLMRDKRIDKVIKLQLEQNQVENITPNLVTLIQAENRYKHNVFYEEFETKEEFEKRTKEIMDEKDSLMATLQIDQDLLDKYMSFINLEK